MAANSNELINDESADHNIRYVGSNPNNYVLFNNELWRIIGVMNNIDDGNGNLESRLKLIRNESIGEYSWDYNSDGTYDNDWTTSTLMELLIMGHIIIVPAEITIMEIRIPFWLILVVTV